MCPFLNGTLSPWIGKSMQNSGFKSTFANLHLKSELKIFAQACIKNIPKIWFYIIISFFTRFEFWEKGFAGIFSLCSTRRRSPTSKVGTTLATDCHWLQTWLLEAFHLQGHWKGRQPHFYPSSQLETIYFWRHAHLTPSSLCHVTMEDNPAVVAWFVKASTLIQ